MATIVQWTSTFHRPLHRARFRPQETATAYEKLHEYEHEDVCIDTLFVKDVKTTHMGLTVRCVFS